MTAENAYFGYCTSLPFVSQVLEGVTAAEEEGAKHAVAETERANAIQTRPFLGLLDIRHDTEAKLVLVG